MVHAPANPSRADSLKVSPARSGGIALARYTPIARAVRVYPPRRARTPPRRRPAPRNISSPPSLALMPSTGRVSSSSSPPRCSSSPATRPRHHPPDEPAARAPRPPPPAARHAHALGRDRRAVLPNPPRSFYSEPGLNPPRACVPLRTRLNPPCASRLNLWCFSTPRPPNPAEPVLRVPSEPSVRVCGTWLAHTIGAHYHRRPLHRCVHPLREPRPMRATRPPAPPPRSPPLTPFALL
jgi:hypothetical protein